MPAQTGNEVSQPVGYDVEAGTLPHDRADKQLDDFFAQVTGIKVCYLACLFALRRARSLSQKQYSYFVAVDCMESTADREMLFVVHFANSDCMSLLGCFGAGFDSMLRARVYGGQSRVCAAC